MELYLGFRKLFLFICFLVCFGNAKAQGGAEGMAIGLGLGGDLMIDTGLGEMPNPLLTMAAQDGQQTLQTTPTNPVDMGQQTAQTASTSALDSNQKYVLKNEAFTALGNVGHDVRVPIPDIPNLGSTASSSGLSPTSKPVSGGTITIDPKDIIGVADMNQMGADGNPTFFSFNPGSGHASEISALQNALQGTAVDMSGFLPPPFDPQVSSFSGTGSSSSFTTNTKESMSFDINVEPFNRSTIQNTQEMNIGSPFNNMNHIETSMANNNQRSALTGANKIQDSLSMNEQLLYNTLTNNETIMSEPQFQSMLENPAVGGRPDVGGNSLAFTITQVVPSSGSMSVTENTKTNTNEQSMNSRGSLSGRSFDLNEQSMTNTNENSMFGTGSISVSPNFNDISMTNTNEELMFNAGGVSSGIEQPGQSNINIRDMLVLGPSGGAVGVNSNNQLISVTNEQSMFGTDSVSDIGTSGTIRAANLNEQSLLNINDQSSSGTGGLSNTMPLNEKLLTGLNEQLMFDTNIKTDQNVGLNENSILNSGVSTGVDSSVNQSSFVGIGGFDTRIGTNDVNALPNTNKQSTSEPMINQNQRSSQTANEQTVSITDFNSGIQDKQVRNIDSMYDTVGSLNTLSDISLLTETQNQKNKMVSNEFLSNTNIRTNTPSQSVYESNVRDGISHRRNTGQGSIGIDLNSASSVSNKQTSSNVGKIDTSIPSLKDQAMINNEMRLANIITKDQLLMNRNTITNEPAVVNVDTNIGVRIPNTERTSIGGLFGVVDQRNEGSIGSKSNAINKNNNNNNNNNNINKGMSLGGEEQMYAVADNIATGTVDGAKDNNLSRTKVDSVNTSRRGTESVLGVSGTKTDSVLNSNNKQLSLPLKESVLSTADSARIFQEQIDMTGTTTGNIPHVNDLNTEGIYPFEGSLSARDATISEGSSAVMDMNSVLTGHEPLHLEPTVGVVGEFATDAITSGAAGSNTGIFAVGSPSNLVGGQGTTHFDTNLMRSNIDISSSTGGLKSSNPNTNKASDVAFVRNGRNTNSLTNEKLDQYVGVENINNNQNGIRINLIDVSNAMNENKLLFDMGNSPQMANSHNKLIQGDQRVFDASKLSNNHRNGLTVDGNINNNINKFNTLDALGNTVNNKETTVVDMAGVAMSGFSGAPMTNMVGVRPGTSRGGLTVKDINFPTYEITSKTNEFSSNSSQDISGLMSDKTDLPSGSFVIGAGQPNSKVIKAGNVGSLSSANVGGVAIGSGMPDQIPSIAGISLPSNAFKSNNRLNHDTKQTNTESQKSERVDMSSFIPPPYIDPRTMTSLNIQDRTSLRDSATENIVNNEALIKRLSQNAPIIETQNNHNSNAAFTDRQKRINDLRNLEVSNQDSSFAHQFLENVNNRIASTGGQSSRQSIGANEKSFVTNTRAPESSNIVMSTEHFGKPISSNFAVDNFFGSQNSKTSSLSNIKDQSAVPSIVVDQAIFTDLNKETNTNHRSNKVATALDIHSSSNQAFARFSPEQYSSQPIVGSIFGTVGNGSETLTKRFLEQSGITREPSVDFMSNFLQHSKPTRTLNRGNKNLQIVPLGSDMSNLSPNTDKIIIAGRQSDAQTVDQFGVADIYTRRQQLNPSQWQQLMAKVSHEPNYRSNGINVDYQTQNVIGTSETKPLRNMNQGTSISGKRSLSEFSSNTITRKSDKSNTNGIVPSARNSKLRSSILFEAPGMTGHKSVSIRNYTPRIQKRPHSGSTILSSIKTSNDIGKQNLQEFVGTQATAERTSSFANTFRQNHESGAMGLPISNKNAGASINSASLPLKDRLSSEPQIQLEGQLGESGQKIQNEMNTFKLGRSILISDGMIPEFTRPNSMHRISIDANDIQGLSANGIRLGQPSILSQSGSLGSEMNNKHSTLESVSSQASNGQQSDLGLINSPMANNQRSGIRSLDSQMVNTKQSNLLSLDTEMTNTLQSKRGAHDRQIANTRQANIGSQNNQILNNPLGSIGSRESRTNEQSRMGSIDLLLGNNRKSTFGSLNSQTENNRQSALGSALGSVDSQMMNIGQSRLDSQLQNSRLTRPESFDSQLLNNRQNRLGSVDSQLVNNRQNRLGSVESQLVNNRKNGVGSLESQLLNNRQNTLGSIDSQFVNNRQNTLGSIDSQFVNNRQNTLGSIDSQFVNNRQNRLGSLDSQLVNNRQNRINSVRSPLNNLQSSAMQSQSESQKTSTGEITFQDIEQGSLFGGGLGPGRQGNSLSNRLGIAIGGDLGSEFSGGLSQSQQNMGIAVSGDLMNAMSNINDVTKMSGSGNTAIQNIGIASLDQGSAGASASNTGQRTTDTATIIGLNNALRKQPMEATLFTSGSRFAVFGPADDVTGRALASKQTKPIPARRMGVLGPVHNCRYKPDPTSEYYFIYKNGITQHRFRCALGTAFDGMSCECSIRVSDHGDCLEVHMDFNNGIVEDSSLNRLPIGNENVEITNSSSPLAGIALFGGDGQLTVWRYQNYDFRDHIMLKVQFRPGVGGDRLQPLISNCDGGGTGPSVAIIYDSTLFEVILILQTVNDTQKELRFKVNPDEWNDVTYIYDGQEFIGIVNGVRRYVSRENPHLLGIIGGEIKSTPAQGLIEIRDAAVVLGHCPMYGYFRGAMVDIQVYTCIPKDFRLE